MGIRWKNADGDTKWAFSAAEQEAEMKRDDEAKNGNTYEDGVVKVHGSAMPQREPSRGGQLDFTHTDGNARASAGDGVAIADARDGGRAVAASGEPGKIGSAMERFEKR